MTGLFDFLEDHNKHAEEQQVNWQTVRDEWIAEVEEFMNTIEAWIIPESKKGRLSVEKVMTTITEENLGTYRAPSLHIKIAASQVNIIPVGRLIIGAQGRIDIKSYADEYLVLKNSEGDWVYRNILHNKKYLPFTEEGFATILKDLLNED